MNLSGSGSVAVYQGDGLTMISMKKRNRQVSVQGASSTIPGITSDFSPSLWRGEDGTLPGVVIIQAGQVFERQTAYENDLVPGIDYPATTVSAPAGPTTGYIYLEIPVSQPVDNGGIGGDYYNSESAQPEIPPGSGSYPNLISLTAGSSHTSISAGTIKFYETMQTPSSEYFRKVLSSVVVDGNGGITSVNQIHYGDVFLPYGNIASGSISSGAS